MDKISFSNSKRKDDLHKNLFEDPLNSKAYDTEINILNKIILGITRTQQKENPDITEEIVWKDLQKAYFEGQTVWLRKIEDIFGEGTLRIIGELRPNEYEKTDEVLNILSKKVEGMK